MMPMLPMRLVVLAAALTCVIGAAERVPVATPTGPAEACIPIAQIDQSIVRDDRTIDFVMRSRRVYRVSLPNRCPQLGFEQRFSYEISLAKLCATDIITVLSSSPPIQGVSCGLPPFQPVTLAK